MPSPMACVEFTPKVGSSVQVGTEKLTLPARYAPRVQIMVSHDLRTLERTLRPSASFDAPQVWAPQTFSAMTAAIKARAAELCDGRLVLVHEGGYSEVYVPFCGHATISTYKSPVGLVVT